MKLFHAISKVLGLTPMDRIDNAVNRASNLASELAKHETREQLYGEALKQIDHEYEWNLYAHFKQKEYDARAERLIAQRRYRDAVARANELIEKNVPQPYRADGAAVLS